MQTGNHSAAEHKHAPSPAGTIQQNGNSTAPVNRAEVQSKAANKPKENGSASGGQTKKRTQSNAAFRRVDPEKWAGQAAKLDNSYFGTFTEKDYGYKAQERLGSVKGKDFQKEKTKRKRSTYRGGSIDPSSVKSIKFDE